MKFKEVEIIKSSFFFTKCIARYNDYMGDKEVEMIEKFSSCIPRKGDVISVINKDTNIREFLKVKHVFIDYVSNKMTIWC